MTSSRVTGWRARIGVLVPPGNPTVEPEMNSLPVKGVAVYGARMSATGVFGSPAGQDDRNRQQLAGLPQTLASLAQVEPDVVVLAHTATSYTLGRSGEEELIAGVEAQYKFRFITAFSGIVAALKHLGLRRIAYGTPYSAETTERGRVLLEEHGFEIVTHLSFPGVANIYRLTSADAYALGRMVDRSDADAILISGNGMPTLSVLDQLECDLGKPVISASSATMWHALRTAGVKEPVLGAGTLLRS